MADHEVKLYSFQSHHEERVITLTFYSPEVYKGISYEKVRIKQFQTKQTNKTIQLRDHNKSEPEEL